MIRDLPLRAHLDQVGDSLGKQSFTTASDAFANAVDVVRDLVQYSLASYRA